MTKQTCDGPEWDDGQRFRVNKRAFEALYMFSLVGWSLITRFAASDSGTFVQLMVFGSIAAVLLISYVSCRFLRVGRVAGVRATTLTAISITGGICLHWTYNIFSQAAGL